MVDPFLPLKKKKKKKAYEEKNNHFQFLRIVSQLWNYSKLWYSYPSIDSKWAAQKKSQMWETIYNFNETKKTP